MQSGEKLMKILQSEIKKYGSMKNLAAQIGVTTAAVSHWCSGRCGISVPTAKKTAVALGLKDWKSLYYEIQNNRKLL
jgi:plasmid maintenance system antidote protein VapI